MKYIIAGGRDFSNYMQLKIFCDQILGIFATDEIVIVSGGAKGADVFGKQYAVEHGYAYEEYPADWEKYGKRAGFLRNHQMAQIAFGLIALWDGKSRGTKNMIEEAHKARLETHVKYY